MLEYNPSLSVAYISYINCILLRFTAARGYTGRRIVRVARQLRDFLP
jgi:hypothetical protein